MPGKGENRRSGYSAGASPARNHSLLPDADTRFRVLENNWLQVSCERTSFKLVGMAKDNFPTLPSVPKPQAKVPARVLENLIDRTWHGDARIDTASQLSLPPPRSANMDTLEGIAEWWIARQQIRVDVEILARALRRLTERGLFGRDRSRRV